MYFVVQGNLFQFTGSVCGGTFSSPVELRFNDSTGHWFYGRGKCGKDCLWTIVSPENSTIQLDLIHHDIYCAAFSSYLRVS